MVGFHIVVFLIGQQLRYRLFALLRYAAGDELVQDRKHLVFSHGAALQ